MSKRLDYDKRSRKERSNPELDKLDREREARLRLLADYLLTRNLSERERERTYDLIQRVHIGAPISKARLDAIEKKVRKGRRYRRNSA
jgi:transglutaminase-like putative cysteine protease